MSRSRWIALVAAIVAIILVVGLIINKMWGPDSDKTSVSNDEPVAEESTPYTPAPTTTPNNYGSTKQAIAAPSPTGSQKYPDPYKTPTSMVDLSGESDYLNDPYAYNDKEKDLYDTALKVVSTVDNRYGPQYDSPKQAIDTLRKDGLISQDAFTDQTYNIYTPYGRSVHENGLTLVTTNFTCIIKAQQHSVADDKDPKKLGCYDVRNYVTPDSKVLNNDQFTEKTGEHVVLVDSQKINEVELGIKKTDKGWQITSMENKDNL